jgi:hypothetical protein
VGYTHSRQSGAPQRTQGTNSWHATKSTARLVLNNPSTQCTDTHAPNSSTSTSDCGVAFCRMALTLSISAMNEDTPRLTLSAAPIRTNSLS